jgi:hypothetical protein
MPGVLEGQTIQEQATALIERLITRSNELHVECSLLLEIEKQQTLEENLRLGLSSEFFAIQDQFNLITEAFLLAARIQQTIPIVIGPAPQQTEQPFRRRNRHRGGHQRNHPRY